MDQYPQKSPFDSRFPFGLKEYRDLELSTQALIKAAQARGLDIEVLDRSSNTVRIKEPASGRSEIVVQGTKSRADSYVCTEIMGLKKVTKLLLAEAGLRVPAGRDYPNLEQALADYSAWNGRDCIVKPNSTNYGLGISRLRKNSGEAAYRRALELAFSHDNHVLVEEFIPGKEYRFLVIGGKLQAVLQRIPANVTGDGQRDIAELVAQKNRDPWRVGPQGRHISPLEIIELKQTEREVLRDQGLSPESVPQPGRQIFLRYNSNISTGGDSIDMTEAVHPDYKTLAERCAATLDAKVCGVDVISADISSAARRGEHAIIEANFNPVLYFHEYPATGQSRPVAAAMIELLFPS